MTTTTRENNAVQSKQMLCDLYELIAALDCRVPRLERCGEVRIASEAAKLREQAMTLIREIEGATPME